MRKDRKTNQPRGFAFVTFKEEEAARQAVSNMQGHAYQGRVLTVNTADARGTAASAGQHDKAEGDNDEDDANEWKTAPPSRTKKCNNNKKGSNGRKKTQSRSWDEWASPTAKTSQVAAPKVVPMVSPEDSSKK